MVWSLTDHPVLFAKFHTSGCPSRCPISQLAATAGLAAESLVNRPTAPPSCKLTEDLISMNMNSGSYMNKHLLAIGVAIWVIATLALRLAGQFVLRPRAWPATVTLFAISFVAMAWLARRLCRRLRVPPDQWAAGSISLAAPTLLLDPFSSAFFPVIFPNLAPELAGVFGGWMLCCCAGALLGGTVRPGARS
jgi:hypothetical protein